MFPDVFQKDCSKCHPLHLTISAVMKKIYSKSSSTALTAVKLLIGAEFVLFGGSYYFYHQMNTDRGEIVMFKKIDSTVLVPF